MELNLNDYIKDIIIDQFFESPIGEKLQKAMQILENIQTHMEALSEKQDEMDITGIKAITVFTFAILKKIAEGNKVSELTQDDWKGIANTVSKYAVLMDDDSYSLFVFRAYEKYIRGSVEQIRFNISPETAALILGLADELHEKDTLFVDGHISEVTYIEDCLWISLEAMMKLIASTAALAHCEEFENLSQALATYAFEYGRLMLYKREQEIITQYLEAQKVLDVELEVKYNSYLEDLQKQAEQFNELITNAYAPNFREAFLHSVILAQEAGVEDDAILKTVEDVDDFFM